VLGLAWVNGTNVNLALVQAGLARAEKQYLRGLPLRIRYKLLYATRLAASRPLSAEALTTTNTVNTLSNAPPVAGEHGGPRR
jgi:hypothetical protein